MASHTTPDFSGPRRSGNKFTPDTGAPGATRPRGKYPRDAGGPPETTVGRLGTQGDNFTPATPANKQIARKTPRKTVAGNTSTNPVR